MKCHATYRWMTAFLLWPGTAAYAATYVCGSAEGTAGLSRVDIPIWLQNPANDPVAALQFDLIYDPAILRFCGALSGPIVDAAAKSLYVGQLSEGHLRFVVAGFNQNLLEEGIAATSYFYIQPDVEQGSYPIQIEAELASDPEGGTVSADSVDGSVYENGFSLPLATRLSLSFLFLLLLLFGAKRRPRRITGYLP